MAAQRGKRFDWIGWCYETEVETSAQKFVLHVLCVMANEQGECWPSVPTIAARTMMTERGVQKCLRALEDAGTVRRESRQRVNGSDTSNLYILQNGNYGGVSGSPSPDVIHDSLVHPPGELGSPLELPTRTTRPELVTTSLRSVGEAPSAPSPKKVRRHATPEPQILGDTRHLFEEPATPQAPVATKTVARRRGPVGPDSVGGLVNYFFNSLTAVGIDAAAQGVSGGRTPMMSAMTRLKRKATPDTIRGMVDQYVADPKYRRDDQPEWKGFIFHSAELQGVSARAEERPMTREDWLGTSSG